MYVTSDPNHSYCTRQCNTPFSPSQDGISTFDFELDHLKIAHQKRPMKSFITSIMPSLKEIGYRHQSKKSGLSFNNFHDLEARSIDLTFSSVQVKGFAKWFL